MNLGGLGGLLGGLGGLMRFLRFAFRTLRDDFRLFRLYLRFHRRARGPVLALTTFLVLSTLIGSITIFQNLFGALSVVHRGAHSGPTTGTTHNGQGTTGAQGMAVSGSTGTSGAHSQPVVSGADNVTGGASGGSAPTTVNGSRIAPGAY